MIPELDLARLRKWIEAHNERVPPNARAEIRYELDVTASAVTPMECRPPWSPDYGPEWTRFPICRFRYTKAKGQWALYWRDRNLKFHLFDLVPPSRHIDDLIREVDADRTGIFWG